MPFILGASASTLAYVSDRERWYNLSGVKWFSSATDSDMAFTLARVVDDNKQFVEVFSHRFCFIRIYIIMNAF